MIRSNSFYINISICTSPESLLIAYCQSLRLQYHFTKRGLQRKSRWTCNRCLELTNADMQIAPISCVALGSRRCHRPRYRRRWARCHKVTLRDSMSTGQDMNLSTLHGQKQVMYANHWHSCAYASANSRWFWSVYFLGRYKLIVDDKLSRMLCLWKQRIICELLFTEMAWIVQAPKSTVQADHK